MPLPLTNDTSFDLFDLNEYNHYLRLAIKEHKTVDVHLLEYVIASYLIYDAKGLERPKEDSPDFIKANEKIKELIENTAKLNEEVTENPPEDTQDDTKES